jgi:hypothetical protein
LAAGPLIDLPAEQIQRTFDTNTFSLLRVAKAVIPSMADRKSGLIVNIGSVSGELYVGSLLLILLINCLQPDTLEWAILCDEGCLPFP